MTPTAPATAADPWLAWNATIASVTPEAPGVATWELTLDDATVARQFFYEPGQFNMIWVPGVGESAISMSGDPTDPSCLLHTIRLAGNVTQELARLEPGSSIGIRGPFGSAWPMTQCVGQDVLLVAGGIGLAPLRPVIYEILRRRSDFGTVTLLLGARTPAGLLYHAEQPSWATGVDIQMTVDRATAGWRGNVGVVTTLLERLRIPRPEQTVLMTCGPEVMMWYAIRSAIARGLPESSIWLSIERHMNCAVGFCGHCQLGTEFVCVDGPVFRYDRIAPLLKVKSL